MLKQTSFQLMNIRFYSHFLLFISVLIGVSLLPINLKSNAVEPINQANHPLEARANKIKKTPPKKIKKTPLKKSNAVKPRSRATYPGKARVDSIQKPPVKFGRSGRGGEQPDAKAGNELKHASNRLRVIRGGVANLGFFDNRGSRLGIKNAYVARAPKNDAEFHYMCSSKGNITIAWSDAVTRRGGCDAITVSRQQFSTNKNLSKAQTYQNPVRYCSAVADSGQGWGAVVTTSRWDTLSPNDPCKEAVRRCEVNSGNSPCSVVNMGEQDFTELEKEFTAVLKCGDVVPPGQEGRQRGISSRLDRWVNDQASSNLKSSACSLHVLNSDELLVFPSTDRTTVISVGDDIPPFINEPVIVVLAGTVTIVSPDPNVAPSERKAQQACYPYNANLTLGLKQVTQKQVTQGQITQGQVTQTCARYSAQEFGFNLGRGTRGTTYTSPAIQSFFTGWSPEATDEIKRYQEVVENEFQPPNRNRVLQ